MRLTWYVILLAVLVSSPVNGHPHQERRILILSGTLTKVDAVNRAIELDTFDPDTKDPRNLLLFLDKKLKLRRGKAKIDLAELKAGQQITSTVEVTHDEGEVERFVALDIQLRQGSK
jgi:hypothetical protein